MSDTASDEINDAHGSHQSCKTCNGADEPRSEHHCVVRQRTNFAICAMFYTY